MTIVTGEMFILLKLKDNISLKELEKFGFKYVDDRSFEGDFSHCYKAIGNNVELSISVRGRDIYAYTNTEENNTYIFSDGLDVLFDLIQADLVEKVDEK